MTILATDKAQVEKVVRAFAEKLVDRLGDQVYEVIWYGSTARGDAEKESDIDVAVICQSDDAKTEDFVWGLASDLGLDYDTFLDVRVISRERFYGEWGELSYLAEDIQSEGIPIWTRSEKATATS